MDLRTEISEFLRSRRARLTPERAGLGAGPGRRVPGLRREEVAVLASISVDWYVRIERGNLAGVSDEVLDALSAALQLDEAEAAHLADLARAARSSSRRPAGAGRKATLRPGLQIMIDSMQGLPAWARNHRFEIVATNALARALYADLLRSRIAAGNNARFTFLDPIAQDFYVDWEKTADDVVAVLRGYVGANPADRRLSNLVGELATRSPDFARRWAAYDVKYHRTGRKTLHHQVVGDLDLGFEALALPENSTLGLFVYYPADESTRERLQLLESWAATEERDQRPAGEGATDVGRLAARDGDRG
ncbi:helix-turn-helix transcriptional regulator [Amycolatopsis sp. Hca4]|uniref:helix-turn-helix transcriptional regulator n=1 Tax=Amycolatopsis sp. Hca4 TaxID=2742131 RepID=UPI0015916766|nr:helix-turn-helix transcriptional regulator [Amycolatopsis sp. Hca4]QKV73782.1 helix-turn-helix domain-containing protein [Amycolatopsis sp. Hca4]